ncbi:MAG: carbonic anhydrase [Taibaiella sp.]|nr:carbonic anhydrase [Taibaiella sp.]
METFNQPYANLTPAMALQLLQHGNFRFVNNLGLDRNHITAVDETKDGQYPFAAIFSCMDSRTSAELIFDQGFGDIFSIRVAGNVISDDVLGSLEYATAVAGSKLIVVLGHTNCGAIGGACNDVKLGHLTSLLAKIAPAIFEEKKTAVECDGDNKAFVNNVAKVHVKNSVKEILSQSSIINELVHSGNAGIIPAMYDVATGQVHFYQRDAVLWKDDTEENHTDMSNHTNTNIN